MSSHMLHHFLNSQDKNYFLPSNVHTESQHGIHHSAYLNQFLATMKPPSESLNFDLLTRGVSPSSSTFSSHPYLHNSFLPFLSSTDPLNFFSPNYLRFPVGNLMNPFVDNFNHLRHNNQLFHRSKVETISSCHSETSSKHGSKLTEAGHSNPDFKSGGQFSNSSQLRQHSVTGPGMALNLSSPQIKVDSTRAHHNCSNNLPSLNKFQKRRHFADEDEDE